MPGKGRGRGITSCDYKGELRKPGERRINSSHHDGDEHVTSTSAAAQTERENSVSGVNDLSSLTNEEEKDTDVFNADEKKEFENNTSSSKDEPDRNTSKSNQDDTVAIATNHTQEESNSGSLTPEPKTPISTLSISSVATSKLSPFAKEFVPKSHLPSALKSKPSHLSASSTGPDSVLIDCVKDTIYQLSLDPGELEAIVDGLVETMEGWISQDETLAEIANLIVTQAVTEPNFTYTGARLADYLDKNMNLGKDTKKKFRDFFLQRCREELLKKDELKSNPSSEPHVLGFAKFLAELFCNFRSWSKDESFHIFHKALLQILDTLIEHGSDEAFRCVGQIMKMTGYLTDNPVYKNLKDREHKVDTIFDCLNKAIKESKTCSESTKNFLQSLFELRANNWGQNEPETQVEGTPEAQLPEGTLDSAQAQQYAYYSSNTEGLESNTEGLATDALGLEPWSTGYYDADEYYQYPDDMQQYDAEQYIPEEEGAYGGYEDLEDPEFAELEADFEKFLSMQ